MEFVQALEADLESPQRGTLEKLLEEEEEEEEVVVVVEDEVTGYQSWMPLLRGRQMEEILEEAPARLKALLKTLQKSLQKTPLKARRIVEGIRLTRVIRIQAEV